MKIEPTTDKELIRSMTGNLPMPELDLWVGKEGVTVLVAEEEGKAKMLALLLDKGETGEHEVHIQSPTSVPHAARICNGFRNWILGNKPDWTTLWSYALDARTLAFAQHLGFHHAFNEGERSYIVLKLR